MNPEDSGWQKLVTAARRAPDERDTSAPYGFATRVAARAMAAERPRLAAVLERFSWRALALAGALAVISVAANYQALATAGATTTTSTSNSTEEDALPDVTTVTAVYDVS